jgi:hypothetical protein
MRDGNDLDSGFRLTEHYKGREMMEGNPGEYRMPTMEND